MSDVIYDPKNLVYKYEELADNATRLYYRRVILLSDWNAAPLLSIWVEPATEPKQLSLELS